MLQDKLSKYAVVHKNVLLLFLPPHKAKHSIVRSCHGTLVSCPSVRLSVTLVDCDDTHWNSSKKEIRSVERGRYLSHCHILLITSCTVKKTVTLPEQVQKQARREGGKGRKVFPGPATFGGPRRRSKILKIVFQMASFGPKIYIKSIFGPEPRTPLGELTMLPQTPRWMVRGHISPRFLPQSQDIQNGGGGGGGDRAPR